MREAAKIKLPWIRIGSLIGKLVVSAKGGLTTQEAEELLSDLGDIISKISVQLP